MRIFITVICFLASIVGAQAQQFDTLYQEFDPRKLSTDDKKYIQMSLAFLGTYEALIDGKWGRGSQAALRRAIELPAGSTVTNRDVAEAVDAFHRQYASEGWDYVNDEVTGLSFLAPDPAFLQASEQNGFRTWAHTRRPLEYLLVRTDNSNTSKWHAALLERRGFEGKPYTVRNDNRWITSVNQTNGNSTYARSERLNGKWSTLIISSRDGKQDNAFKAVASSIRAGRSNPMALNGFEGLGSYLALNREFKGQAQPKRKKKRSDVDPIARDNTRSNNGTISAGAGIVVNKSGILLTSRTNIQGCSQVLVAGQPAQLVAQNELFDLAALRANIQTSENSWARFATRPIEPNADFAIAGYEPRDFWADMMIDRGRIGADIGDSLAMALSGNVSHGYSGGPVLNRNGAVVGLIVVDAAPSVRRGNTSIKAVHGEVVKLFLAQNRIAYNFKNPTEKTSQASFENVVKRFTMPVECVPK